MRIRDYVASKTVLLCLAAMAGLYLSLVCYFCGIPFSLMGILLISGGMILLLSMIIDWRRTDRRLRLLRSRLDALPEKYLIGETLDRPRNAVEMEYYLLMKEISRNAIGAVEEARAEKQDYCEYVERWVHEIKTPLTASSLILSNGVNPVKLRRELRRADNLTETILTYAKLRTAEKDTQVSLVDLRGACDEAIREEMELLIAADISASVDGEAAVYTDPKLLVFMLKQLLINCAKYCPGCQIQIALGTGCLIFEDNGPGIPAHELTRVTQRGFTGSAGRAHGCAGQRQLQEPDANLYGDESAPWLHDSDGHSRRCGRFLRLPGTVFEGRKDLERAVPGGSYPSGHVSGNSEYHGGAGR